MSGALSARLTRELLDRVNHPERFYQQNYGAELNIAIGEPLPYKVFNNHFDVDSKPGFC